MSVFGSNGGSAASAATATASPLICHIIPGAFYVLLIGESGHGKSMFVNTAIDRFRKGSLRDLPSSLKVAIPCRSYPVDTEP